MIRTFKNKDLKQLFETGRARRLDSTLQRRCIDRLAVLNRAANVRDLDVHGYELHQWKGAWKNKWSISVSGPWRITFTWENGAAYDVDLEQPH